MPDIVQTFEVDRSLADVWAFFEDVPQVAECMPGAELLEAAEDGSYKGKLKVKLGPITAQFDGRARFTERDATAHAGVIEARGADRRGGSRGSAVVQYKLTEAETRTTVQIHAEIKLQGSIAQFGRTGLLDQVAQALTAEFARCLNEKLAAGTHAEADAVTVGEVKGFQLLLKAATAWFRRVLARRSLLGRPRERR